MSRYHNQYNGPSSERRITPRSGVDRRGVIPHIETPEEKIERLQQLGYDINPVPAPNLNEDKSLELSLGNQELPAYQKKQDIMNAVTNNRIVMLVGPTGSGKTTQIGQYALEKGYKTIFLVPRRVIANNIGERVEEELSRQIGSDRAGEIVGISHSERNTVDDKSEILVMTSGTFTKRLPELADRWRGENVLVVADEIHEGNLETEFASALAVMQVEKDSAWRLMFASATPDTKTITKTYKLINGAPIPIIEIEGRPYGLEVIQESDQDITEAYLRHSVGVQKTMIFVEGKRAIEQAINELKKAMTDDERRCTRFFKLHADISEAARKQIFEMELKPGEKAVIVSTSAGQSGITIPGVGLVVSSGLTKSPELDDEGAPGLPIRHCTQAEIVQQGGRAGRDISGGKCVLARPIGYDLFRNRRNPLYDFIPLESREPHIPPEIYHTNISRNILAASALGYNGFDTNNYLRNSVSPATISDSYELLANLGAVDDQYNITDLGRLMDVFPLRPELSRAVAEVVQSGKKLPIQVYTLAIAAAINYGGLVNFDGNNNDDWKRHLNIGLEMGDDFMAQLDLMLLSREYFDHRITDEGDLRLRQMGLNPRKVELAHKSFNKMCHMIGLDPRDIEIEPPREDEINELYDIFLSGMPELLYKRASVRHDRGLYRNVLVPDGAIDRQISNRSLLSMGQSAVKLVAGYPRWFLDDKNQKHSIIEMAFPVSTDQIKRVLGHLAVGSDVRSSIRGLRLVQGGELRFGSLDLGPISNKNVQAVSAADIELLVEHTLMSRQPAVEYLLQLGVSEDEIRYHCEQLARNASSIEEVNARLWGVVGYYQ